MVGDERTYFWMGRADAQPGQQIEPAQIAFWGRFADTPLIIDPKQVTTVTIERGVHGHDVEHRKTDIIYPTPEATAEALLETVFEMVRCCEFPNRPSRFSSLFTWEHRGWAEAYRGNSGRGAIYEVRPVGEALTFSGDFSLITNFEQPDSINKMRARARRYWSGEMLGKYETLVRGPIEILRRLDG